jgi:hypothetical protein
MRKTQAFETKEKITVDIVALQAMLSVGRKSATEIGEKAGAVTRVGRRKLYNVEKVKQYMDSLTEVTK